jgi:simple sugar transport system substrate-binding protein
MITSDQNKVSRRKMISGMGAAAVVAAAAAGGIGYYAGSAAAPPPGVSTATVTKTEVSTAAVSAPVGKPEFDFEYIDHATADPFHSVIVKGYQDALKLFNCTGEAHMPTTVAGDVEEERRMFMAALQKKPDGIMTTCYTDTMNEPVAEALKSGVPVIGYNVDAPGSTRLAYVGSDLYQDGYNAARITFTGGYSPISVDEIVSSGGSHVVVVCEEPTSTWSVLRFQGMEDFLKDSGLANARSLPLLDLGGWDRPTMLRRIDAYLTSHPDTNVFLTPGTGVEIAMDCQQRGIDPTKMAIIAFDLRPETLQWVQDGYIKLTFDQGPYYQGFIPIMMLYHMAKYKMGAFDAKTGGAYVTIDTPPSLVLQLAQEHYR